MYTTTHVNRDKPPRATRFLNRRVLCGHCNFKCCNSPSLNVETTPDESKRLRLPLVFPQDGHCRCLTDGGCRHGDDRPVFCKLFPAQLTPTNTLIVSHWCILNCPTAGDYSRDDNGDWVRRPGVAACKKNNSPETIDGSCDLSRWPTILEAVSAAVTLLWGAVGLSRIRNSLRQVNLPKGGLPLLIDPEKFRTKRKYK